MQPRARICLGLQPNKRILKDLASHFHTNIALQSSLLITNPARNTGEDYRKTDTWQRREVISLHGDLCSDTS